MSQSSMCVAVTGATGFVGRHVLPQLLAAGHRARVLVRDPRKLGNADARVTQVIGDLFDSRALADLLEGAQAVVHLVGIIMQKPRDGQTFQRIHVQGTVNLVDAAKAAGVKRWVQMSALGTRPDAKSEYHLTKWAGESAVRASGIPFTVFRPSIIHGHDGEFMQMVKGFCCDRFPPFLPYFGAGLFGAGGAGRLQPVYVEDVARCFVAALTTPKSIGETYPMGGPDTYTWPELYLTCQRHLPKARKKKPFPVPACYAMMISGLPSVPFNRDQVIMSQEDSTCQIQKVQTDFGIELAPFEATFESYAAQI